MTPSKRFKNIVVKIPDADCDVELQFTSGKVLVIQCRPSNADTDYNGSLDIILPEDGIVCLWKGDDMEAAPKAGRYAHHRMAKQLVMELP